MRSSPSHILFPDTHWREHNNEVATVGYQHGLNFNQYFTGLGAYERKSGRSHAVDRYALWTEYFRRKLVGFSKLYSRENTFVSGNLRPPTPERFQLQERPRKLQATTRVLLISEPQAKKSELLPFVRELASSTDVCLLLKLRPGEAEAPLRSFFGELLDKIELITEPSLFDALEQADVVVGMYSSVLYEALLANKPVVVLKNTSPFSLVELAPEKVAELAESPSSVVDVVIRAARLPENELIRRKELVWGGADAGGAQRVVQMGQKLSREFSPEPTRLQTFAWKFREGLRALYQYPTSKLTTSTINYELYWQQKRPTGLGTLSAFQLERAKRVASLIEPGTKVLDLGCGDGALLNYLREQKNIEGIGADVSRKALRSTSKLGFEAHPVNLTDLTTIQDLPRVDYVVALEVLEHLPEPEALLAAFENKCQKAFIVSFPNTGYFLHRLRLLFGSVPSQWLVHPGEHLRFWTVRDAKWWVNAMGRELEGIELYEGIPLLNKLMPSWFARGIVLKICAE